MVTKEQPRYAQRIIQDPNILAGKPVIRETRIPVGLVLEYLANNPNFDDLFSDYPRLNMDDVKACFEFAQALVEQKASVKARDKNLPPATATG